MMFLPFKKRHVRLPRRSTGTVFIAGALLFAVMCLIFPGFLSFASPVQIIIQHNTNNDHRHHFLSYKRNPVNEPEPLKGADILMVCGSDGGHPLDQYENFIKGNRQQYAAIHGNSIHPGVLTLGYNILFANFSEYRERLGDAPKVWAKIPIIADAFEKYPNTKWLWWLDFDALIMTPTIDLGAHILNPDVLLSKMLKGGTYPLGQLGENGGEELIKYKLPETPDPNKINFIISGDQNGLNAGSFFFRRCTWTSILLDLWIDPLLTHKTEWWALEQDALIHMLRHHHFIRHHMAIVPQRTINAYPGSDINSISLAEKLNLTAGFWEPNDLVLHFAGCG